MGPGIFVVSRLNLGLEPCHYGVMITCMKRGMLASGELLAVGDQMVVVDLDQSSIESRGGRRGQAWWKED
jgi:hypothetical protein